MAIVYDYKIGAGGSAVPFTSGITHLVSALTASTSYDFYVRARDTVTGLASSWVGPVTEATEAAGPPSAWEAPVPSGWAEDPSDKSREGTSSTFAGVIHIVAPKFNDVGDWVEMEVIEDGTGYLGKYVLTDSLGKEVTLNNTGGIVSTDEPDQYPPGWVEGDVIKIERTGATQFTRYINGAGGVVINQALTGEVELVWETQTVSGVKSANPVHNIT
jgi:hypothetical protein